MKVLLPLDIAHPVKPTIDLFEKLVSLDKSEVTLLYVKEEWPSYERRTDAMGEFKDDWWVAVEDRARAAFQEAAQLLEPQGAKVFTEIVTGPPAAMIENVARDEGFELTVLNPGIHHSAVERFLLGSVSSNVVKHGPGTILICRPGTEKLRQVVIGMDGSKQARFALKQAIGQFNLRAPDVRVHLIHVVSLADIFKMVSPVEYVAMIENNMVLEGETYLAEGKKLLADVGLAAIEMVLKEGDPATEIINLARTVKADLVVIGAQGRTAVQHFLLGSVSERIAMHAPSSTAVVKMTVA